MAGPGLGRGVVIRTGLPWRSGVYGLGSMASTALTTTIVTWLLFYASGGAAPDQHAAGYGYFGMAMALGRIVDALADPVIGRWSDRTRTRLGRRAPFVLFGAVPLGISFALLWMPYTGAPVPVLAARMGFALSAFFALYTIVVCPYLAMLPEITTDSRLRLRLASWQAMGAILGGGAIGLFGARLFDRFGFPRGGAVIGAAAAAAFLGVGLAFSRQSGYQPAARTQAGPDGLVGPLREAWRLVAQQRTFRFFLLGMGLLWIGLNMMVISLPYVVTCVLRQPITAVGALAGANLAGTLVMLPLVGHVARARGKIPALKAAAILMGGIVPFLTFGPAGAWLVVSLAGPLAALVYTLPNPVLAEITDGRRRETGDGQEALHFGAQGLVLKGALAAAAWLAGMVFAVLGASPERWGGLRLVTLAGGLLCVLSGLALGKVEREMPA